MRFPAKSAVIAKWQIWTYAVLGVFFIIYGIAFWSRKPFSGAIYFSHGVFFLSFPLSSYIIPIFIYSEMDSTCLRLHKFWKKRKIAWHEVTSAGRFGFGTDDVDDVIVRFGHQIEDYNYILTQPADREGFLAAIRQYAPKAKVEV